MTDHNGLIEVLQILATIVPGDDQDNDPVMIAFDDGDGTVLYRPIDYVTKGNMVVRGEQRDVTIIRAQDWGVR